MLSLSFSPFIDFEDKKQGTEPPAELGINVDNSYVHEKQNVWEAEK